MVKGVFGPFHRLLSQDHEEFDLVEKSAEVWGTVPRGIAQSNIRTVKAYNGPLPDGRVGFEFRTDIQPQPGGGGISFWREGMPGVVIVDDTFVRISIRLDKINRHRV